MRRLTAPVAAAITTAVVAVAIGGQLLADRDPTGTVTAPWAAPTPGLPLGADGLGRDVLARVLAGGRNVTLVSLCAAAAATVSGVAGGLWAGSADGRGMRAVMAGADVLLALPVLLVALVAVVTVGGPAAVVVATVLAGAPLTLRVMADATADARHAGYVEVALARGESRPSVLLREMLPAHAGLVGADLGQRTVLAVHLAAALAFLGFGPPPPAPDWGAMLRENLPGLGLNPAAVLAPAIALAVMAGSVASLAHVLSSRDPSR